MTTPPAYVPTNQPTYNYNFQPDDFEFVKVCPWCDSHRKETWGKDIGYFHTVQCGACGLIYVDNRLNAEAIRRFYSRYYSQEHQAVPEAKMRDKMYQLEYDFIRQHIAWGKVLDIGCSGGEFLDYFDKARFDCYGLEPGVEAAEVARQKYGQDKIISVDLLQAECPGPFDLIILRGTIEHIPQAKVTLAKAASLLNRRKKSYLYITSTPNADCLCAKIFRTQWILHFPEGHIFHFKKEHIDEVLVKQCGLQRVAFHQFYEETLYANVEQDLLKVARAIELTRQGKAVDFLSPPFYGNMMTLVYAT